MKKFKKNWWPNEKSRTDEWMNDDQNKCENTESIYRVNERQRCYEVNDISYYKSSWGLNEPGVKIFLIGKISCERGNTLIESRRVCAFHRYSTVRKLSRVTKLTGERQVVIPSNTKC